MQLGKEGLANASCVDFLFYFIKSPPFPAPTPQHATSNNTAKLHWIPTLLFLIFVWNQESKNIWHYIVLHWLFLQKWKQHKTCYIRKTAQNLCTSTEDIIQKALKE